MVDLSKRLDRVEEVIRRFDQAHEPPAPLWLAIRGQPARPLSDLSADELRTYQKIRGPVVYSEEDGHSVLVIPMTLDEWNELCKPESEKSYVLLPYISITAW